MEAEIEQLKSELFQLKHTLRSQIKKEVNAAVVRYRKQKCKISRTQEIEQSSPAKAVYNSVNSISATKLRNRSILKRKASLAVDSLKLLDEDEPLDEIYSIKRRKRRNLSIKKTKRKQIKKRAFYKCHTCQEEFNHQTLFNKHIMGHELESNKDLVGFGCPLCEKRFATLPNLFIHQSWHEKGKVVKCLVCNNYFEKMDDLTIHHHKHHFPIPPSLLQMLESAVSKREKEKLNGKKLPSRHNCKYCSKRFSHIRLYNEHVLEHLAELNGCSPISLNCPLCENQYTTSWGVLSHLQYHPNVRTPCSKCDEVFEDTGLLLLHFYRNHFEAPEQIRKFIERSLFGTLNKPKNVKRRKNKDRTPYMCKSCSRAFRSEKAYNKHISKHEPLSEIFVKESVCSIPLNIDPSNEKYLKCFVCSETFDTANGFRTHITNHTPAEISATTDKAEKFASVIQSKVYNCKVCSESFFRISQFRKHVMNFHEDNKELKDQFCFSCSICDKSFSSESNLTFHQLGHGIFRQCPFCEENCATNEIFLKHINDSHSDGNNENFLKCKDGYLCTICGLSVDSQHKMKKHIEVNHLEKPFMCDICGSGFAIEKLLKGHKLAVHTEKNFFCEECGKQFKTKHQLRSHKLRHKNKDERLPCKECDKTFSSLETYQRHYIAIHTNERPYKCTVCGKAFATAPALHFHKTTMCDKSKAKISKCPVCDKSCENYLALFYHKNNTHKYGNKDDDFCLVCNKQFTSPSCLYSHNRMYHTGENGQKVKSLPCICNYCGQSRPNAQLLFDHWLTHKEEKAFECETCNLAFKQRCGFYQHKKIYHKDRKDLKLYTHKRIFLQLKKEFDSVKVFAKSTEEESIPIPQQPELNIVETAISHSDAAESMSQLDRNDQGSYPDGNMNEVLVNIKNSVKDLPQESTDFGLHPPTIVSETALSYIDFSRANVPVPEKISTANTSSSADNLNEIDKEPGHLCDSMQTRCLVKEKQIPSSEQNDDTIDDDNLSDTFEYFSCADGSPMDYDEDNDLSIHDRKPLLSESNLFPQDPFSKKLLILLDRMEEHKCSICNIGFYSSKDYKKHNNSRIHKSALRELKLKEIVSQSEKNAEIKRSRNHGKCLKGKATKSRVKVDDLREKVKRSRGNAKESKKLKIRKRIKSEELLSCPYCQETLSSVQKYRKHIVTHKKRINCLLCPEKFASVRKLVEHYRNLHNGEMVVNCTICQKGFLQYNDALREHMEFSHNRIDDPNIIRRKLRKTKQVKMHKCDICGVQSTEKLFKLHLLSHNKDEHKCEYCPEVFNSQSELENHYNEIHNGEMPFQCEECSQKFSTEVRLQLHKKEMHPLQLIRDPTDMKFVCDICGARILRKNDFVHHRANHAPKEDRRKFFCEFCGKTFLRIHSLTLHKRQRHTGETPFQCDQCEMAFISPALLREHIDGVHKQILSCDICGRSFNRRKNLVAHRKIHPDKNVIYSCIHCFKVFPSQKRLETHIDQIHLKKAASAAFTCEYCNKEFYKEASFLKHSELHNPNRPFGCQQCSFRFNFSSNLILHKKMVHEKNKDVSLSQ